MVENGPERRKKDRLQNVLFHRSAGIKYTTNQGDRLRGRLCDLYALKLIISSTETRTFKKMTDTLVNQGDILYDYGKLFIKSRSTKSIECQSVLENIREIKKLWTLPSTPSNRWEDHTIIQSDIHSDYFHPNLFVLRSTSNLERYDLKSGRLLSTFKLYKDVKFTEITTDDDRNWLVLKSSKHVQKNPSQANKSDILMRYIIFDLLPLQYKYHITIKRSVFGASCRDVLIANGIIMVLRQKNVIECYSLMPFLEHAKEVETSKVDGFYPNVDVDELGPCLLSATSHQHYLAINEGQWGYIKKDRDNQCQLIDLKTGHCINQFKSTRYHIEPDQVFFLEDNSGRLVQFGNSCIKLFARKDNRLQEIFCYHSRKEPPHPNSSTKDEFSRSGRNSTEFALETETISVKYDYEDELDILGLLIVVDQLSDQEERNQTLISCIQEARLYDGKTFELLRVIPINFTAVRPCTDINGFVQLCLDRDIMIIKIKGSMQTLVIPFQISDSPMMLQTS
eukprot:TRINITY_DN3735_c0_g1_i5.p1 TRINITY_DN3735_c0_g1~~TRINITY_DN3735_c0_g1_i5.p1  ORF type:complete len:508 (-),score=47.51 TRINITY_DN3735_c0_g1_i5:70-1593(-)